MSEHTFEKLEVHVAATTRQGYDIQTDGGTKLIVYNMIDPEYANLFAAAPELLEAVKTFVKYAQSGRHPEWTRYIKTIVGQRMLDALAKAQPNP